ncbi:hypothetical protein CEXT_635951 [Caerostris extrusa]|uniref:Uncharacterized protein n=1 Tax=Caerostris extrusa TaxID=172846 RepID=A0AAV4RC53_CAEEX|nr:hypothetical protein CEXT_635951 [Caerostris extrusa]
MDMHVMQNTMFQSSNDVDRQAVYILDPPITIPASLTMTTFAALHTKNINIPKRNCVGGAPVFRGHRSFVPSKEAFISRRSIRTYYRRLQNSVRPENDSLFSYVQCRKIKAEEYNPILLFKPQNSKTLYRPPGLDALLNSDKSLPLAYKPKLKRKC